MGSTGHILITAGPTQEPIDEVRFIGNRSSGRLGLALAEESARRGWRVVLLLGPVPIVGGTPGFTIRRFRTAADLEALLLEEFPRCEVLVMAAAVADYRPVLPAGGTPVKIRRGGSRLMLELESTPDLLAACAERRRPGQMVIGFALEPADRLLASAREKLRRKGVDAIVANPLSAMDAPDIEASLIRATGEVESTPGKMSKAAFAAWLMERIEGFLRAC